MSEEILPYHQGEPKPKPTEEHRQAFRTAYSTLMRLVTAHGKPVEIHAEPFQDGFSFWGELESEKSNRKFTPDAKRLDITYTDPKTGEVNTGWAFVCDEAAVHKTGKLGLITLCEDDDINDRETATFYPDSNVSETCFQNKPDEETEEPKVEITDTGWFTTGEMDTLIRVLEEVQPAQVDRLTN